MPGPVDFFRSRFDNLRAHPFQFGLSTLAGGLVPGGGLLANAAFNRYNNNNFNNAASQSYQHGEDIGNQAAQAGFDRPLNGPNALVSGLDRRNDLDHGLADALTGGGGGMNGGGYTGPTQSPSQWTQQSISGWNPNQANANQNFGLLDFLGPSTNPGGQASHQEIKERLDNRANMGGGSGGNPALYGVSNFMVGGSPVINGVRPAGGDMNQLATYNGRRFGG